MPKRDVLFVFALALCANAVLGQPQGELIDIYTAKVKPEKRSAFEAAMKKMVAANRRHDGDHWVAFYPMYGAAHGAFHFASVRPNLAASETGMEAFVGALTKDVGAANLGRFFDEYTATLESESADIRMRRPDLSVNMPETPEGRLKLIGASRYLRTTIIRLHPGRLPDFTDMWKQIRTAMESGGVKFPFSVSMGTTGPVGVIYLTTYGKSMGDLESQNFSLQQAIGDSAYRAMQDRITQMTAEGRTEIYRISPELSHPPEEVVAAAPEFWRPKPRTTPAKPKSPQ